MVYLQSLHIAFQVDRQDGLPPMRNRNQRNYLPLLLLECTIPWHAHPDRKPRKLSYLATCNQNKAAGNHLVSPMQQVILVELIVKKRIDLGGYRQNGSKRAKANLNVGGSKIRPCTHHTSYK